MNETNRERFIRLITDFDFHINFIGEKKRGRIEVVTRVEQYDVLILSSDQDFWDFEITLAGLSSESYYELIQKAFDSFIDAHHKLQLQQISRSDCFELLTSEKDKIEAIGKGFKTVWLCDDVTNEGSTCYTDFEDYHLITDKPERIINNSFNLLSSISSFLKIKESFIEKSINLLNTKLEWLKYTNEESFNRKTMKNQLTWNRSDTDLLELITALLEMKAITNDNQKLSRKDAINLFSEFFGIEIKDAESKLSRARDRYSVSPFLSELKKAFDNYVDRQLKR